MKTSELTGPALDWAVAKCEGATENWRADGPFWWGGVAYVLNYGHDVRFTPSTDWAQAGPIIEREDLQIGPVADATGWYAYKMWGDTGDYTGPTPLIAAMRCYVASVLGDEVEIPEELQ